MAPGDAAPYRISPRALADLDDIWRYSPETWSVEQADRYVDELERIFETIAAMPGLARERPEFAPPVHIHMHESHLIVYVIVGDHIAILRHLGGQQDWMSVLEPADL